jgi:hypothetical protein
MARRSIILILLIVLVALSALLAVIINFYQASLGPAELFGPRIPQANPGDFELYYMARTILSTINIVLTVILIFNYASIYHKTKSQFSIGLVLFATFFLIKDVAWSPFVIGLAGFGTFGLGPFAFLPDLFEMSALLVLFYLSVRY